MTAERWQQIEHLFQEASARPPSQREAFLQHVCAGDDDLRAEVERLLSGEAALGRFLESPAVLHHLSPGTRMGPYEIDSLLGAGGMGEVYKAHDSRLKRTVAIKVLPAYVAADMDRRKRLLREARTASALNHPNIVTIYDVVSEAGRDSIVMEYIEGRTLEQVIERKPLPHDEVFRHGIQIAATLAAAHAAGIIHRDLKPGNIMVTKAGIKVLDFGLAKLDTDETLTQSRVVMGTPAYMSPEQSAGKPCDPRTDIYALGLILSEMATGTRTSANLPPRLAHVIQRCLEQA